jgi:hypothetical protein
MGPKALQVTGELASTVKCSRRRVIVLGHDIPKASRSGSCAPNPRPRLKWPCDAAGWITGQVINADGAQILRRGPDFTAMLEPVFGADGLRGVV